jgi:predicted DNA-binding protein YlxM (UPF0122 family)
MVNKTEVLKRSPLWALSFIFNDMQNFAHQIGDKRSFINASSEEVIFPDLQLSHLVQHLTDTTRCLLNYCYINDLNLEDVCDDHQDHLQAIYTWDVVTTVREGNLDVSLTLYDRYSDRSYMYCMFLWNCAEQILQNKEDVFNDTIDNFIEWMSNFSYKDTKFNDERTQPLFKLITQISNFHMDF